MITCKQCKYFMQFMQDPADVEDRGECHRYPPAVIVTGVDAVEVETYWPDVLEEESCGEGAAA